MMSPPSLSGKGVGGLGEIWYQIIIQISSFLVKIRIFSISEYHDSGIVIFITLKYKELSF